MAYVSRNPMFTSLNDEEEKAFRDYARTTDPERMQSWEIYHPVYRQEWQRRGILPFESAAPCYRYSVTFQYEDGSIGSHVWVTGETIADADLIYEAALEIDAKIESEVSKIISVRREKIESIVETVVLK